MCRSMAFRVASCGLSAQERHTAWGEPVAAPPARQGHLGRVEAHIPPRRLPRVERVPPGALKIAERAVRCRCPDRHVAVLSGGESQPVRACSRRARGSHAAQLTVPMVPAAVVVLLGGRAAGGVCHFVIVLGQDRHGSLIPTNSIIPHPGLLPVAARPPWGRAARAGGAPTHPLVHQHRWRATGAIGSPRTVSLDVDVASHRTCDEGMRGSTAPTDGARAAGRPVPVRSADRAGRTSRCSRLGRGAPFPLAVEFGLHPRAGRLLLV